ncbi:MAG: glycerol-3-phosphate acyltransferase [Chloroflexi bacterium]|nr:glycerol-3-phosphate acyltransferase [Chloroflexota bacterium]
MTILFAYLFGLLLGYVFGAFPTGYFAGLLWNVDVRKHGSGRTGGTNVLRSAGWGAFTITVIGDILKGVIPVLLARWLFPEYSGAHALAVLGVLIGHNWSLWIALLAKPDPRASYAAPPLGWIQMIAEKGRGGAGVAVTAGACLALFPLATLITAPIPLIVLLVVRYASVASLTAAGLFPLVMLYFVLTGGAPWSYFLLSLVIGIIIVFVHKPNIERLRTGTERRFGQRLGKSQNG